jgi:hypothetical protein
VAELVAGCEAGDCQGLTTFMRDPVAVERLDGALRDVHLVDACAAVFAVHACEQQGLPAACSYGADLYTRGNSAVVPDHDRALALHRRGCALAGAEECEQAPQ